MKQMYGRNFYSSEEAARLLGITSRTLQRWFTEEGTQPDKAKHLKPIIELNGRMLFDAEEIHDVAEAIYRVKLDETMARKQLSAVAV